MRWVFLFASEHPPLKYQVVVVLLLGTRSLWVSTSSEVLWRRDRVCRSVPKLGVGRYVARETRGPEWKVHVCHSVPHLSLRRVPFRSTAPMRPEVRWWACGPGVWERLRPVSARTHGTFPEHPLSLNTSTLRYNNYTNRNETLVSNFSSSNRRSTKRRDWSPRRRFLIQKSGPCGH